MARDRIPIYLVIKKTGQYDEDEREYVIVFDSKLTRAAAEAVVARNPGTEVMKDFADNS